MKDYVVCEKRGSHPRIHVKICQQRCEEAHSCRNYQDYLKTCGHDDTVPLGPGRSHLSELSEPDGAVPATP
jgi:hypothetical protein